LVEFNDFIDRLATADTNPLTPTDLQNGCTLCTAATLGVWLAFETNWDVIITTAYLDLICLKVETEPNDWCYIKFQELIAFTDSVKANGDDPFMALAGQSDTYCLQCDLAFLHKWKNIYALYAVATNNASLGEIYAWLETLEVVYAFACVMDENGDNCMVKISNSKPQTDAIGVACTGQPTCTSSADCVGSVRDFADAMGCCLDTWFDFIGFICGLDPTNAACPDQPIDLIRAFITQQCGVTIEPGCGENLHLGLELVAENLAWIWCFNNQDACESLIKDAIAYYLAVARDDLDAAGITIHLREQPNTSPTRRLLTSSDSFTAVSITGISTKNSVGWITNAAGNVFGAGYNSRVTTDQPVSLATQSYSLTSAAAGVAPSMLALLLALAAFFL
jgi:hypothetical protein